MHKLLFVPLFMLSFFYRVKAQDSIPRLASGKKIAIVAGANAALWAGTYIVLNKAWYADYPHEKFHFFNDNSEWNQMDKAGHVWTAYHISRVSAEMWKWTGLSDKNSVILGSAGAMAYQSIIEIQDGFSNEWGFSWGDMAANATGALTFALQELAWKDQRIQIKLGYSPYNYPSELRSRRDDLFGKGFSERILKDYNSQTYWVSANMRSFLPESRLPKWLNISFGYSSDLMLGGHQNSWTDKEGTFFDRSDISRIRRFYLAPDIDLTKIRTKSKLLRGIFFALNTVKFPAPALELSSKGKLKLHGIRF